MDTKTFTSIELFAGVGGLALGLEKAGFDSIGLIEFDKLTVDTLKFLALSKSIQNMIQ